jgi:hypothetical protein
MQTNKTISDSDDQNPKRPAFVIAWDARLVTPEEYAELIELLADLSRLYGAAGIIRLGSEGFDVRLHTGVRM